MREQLIRYVDLLFAGTPNLDDTKQEILQNTLDRFDDLIQQGIAPEKAYSLAISGIGDVSQILVQSHTQDTAAEVPAVVHVHRKHFVPVWKRVLEAIAIGLYILCPIPLIILSEIGQEVVGLSILLSIVAVATALLIVASNHSEKRKQHQTAPEVKDSAHIILRKRIGNVIHTVGIIGYLIFSFLTQAWHITWLVFPIMATLQGLINACLDLKEGKNHET